MSDAFAPTGEKPSGSPIDASGAAIGQIREASVYPLTGLALYEVLLRRQLRAMDKRSTLVPHAAGPVSARRPRGEARLDGGFDHE